MNNLLEQISKPIFFVANDVFRGIGLENLLPNYHIVCLDNHPAIDIIEKQKVSVFCLERALGQRNVLPRNSGTVLEHPLTQEFIKRKAKGQQPNILFFKSQKKLEFLAKKNSYLLLGNHSEMNRRLEDKLSFFNICQENGIPVPPGEIVDWLKVDYSAMEKKYGQVLVIQFGQGWAGNSTFIISTEKSFKSLQKKYNRPKVKISSFINGITYINNAVVYGSKVYQSKPAVQIKPNTLVTATQTGTGGRQWPAEVNNEVEELIKKITEKIGKLIAGLGYQGYFGLDFMADDCNRVYLLECNARQTASTPFYTKLEIQNKAFPLLGYHLLAFLNMHLTPDDYEAPAVTGSEIIARNTSPGPIVVGRNIEPGIYGLDLKLIKKAAYLDSLKAGNYFLSTAGLGRRVNPEIELIRLNTADAVCDSKGEMLSSYIDLIRQIKERLI